MLPTATVELFVQAFCDVITRAACDQKNVVIRNFGTFRSTTVTRHGRKHPTLKLRAAHALKKTLESAGPPMEKYGVEFNNESSLLAKVTGECPSCKSKLTSTSPPHCPNCGTSPFETKTVSAPPEEK